MQLNHVRLLVHDYGAAFRFWRDVVGLHAVFGDEDARYADFETDGAVLALFDASEMADAVPGVETPAAGTSRDAVLLVFRVADVDETFRLLTDRGVVAAAPPADQPEWGIRVAHLRDAEGTLFEINQPLER